MINKRRISSVRVQSESGVADGRRAFVGSRARVGSLLSFLSLSRSQSMHGECYRQSRPSTRHCHQFCPVSIQICDHTGRPIIFNARAHIAEEAAAPLEGYGSADPSHVKSIAVVSM